MLNIKRLKEISKSPSINDLATTYGRLHQGTIDIEIYQAGAMEVVKRIEDKLNLYCDRPSEFYGAIEKMVKELKGDISHDTRR